MYSIKTFNKTTAAAKYLPADFMLADELESYDAILVRSADLHELQFPKELACIARAGAGTNNIPIDRCTESGIAVFNTPGANANAVKELVLCGMLISGRKIIDGANWVAKQKADGAVGIEKAAEKVKSSFAGREIMGKKIGVIGLGAIGALVANACVEGLGMTALGFDPYLSPEAAARLSEKIETTDDVLRIYRECDYITLHLPLLDSTKNTVSTSELRLMKNDAVLLNFARGGLVDEAAVKAALENGEIGGYVADFASDNLIGVSGAILLPHLGASTPEAEENCAQMASEELRDYLLYGKIMNSVNLPRFAKDMTARYRVCIAGVGCEKCCEGIRPIFKNAKAFEYAVRGEAIYVCVDLDEKPDDEALEALSYRDAARRVRVIERAV